MLAMSFLTANFKWILLAVVLFAMLIVGYVADKTDFGHKKTSKKKEIENPNKVEEIDLDNLKGKTLSDMVGGSKEVNDANDINADLNAPFGDVVTDTASTDEPVNNVDDALFQPIGEDLNAPFGDANGNIETPVENTSTEATTEEVNNDVFNNDIFAPMGEVPTSEPVEPISEEIVAPMEETVENEPIENIIPEIPVDTIPENDDAIESAPVVENNIEEIPAVAEEVNNDTVSNDIFAPMEEVPASEPVEPITEELVIPTEEVETPAVETLDDIIVPVETPAEPISEEIIVPSEEVPVVETIEEPKKKEKKKSKKESNKEEVDYEAEVVPEVITEKFNDGSEISSDDDIWKF